MAKYHYYISSGELNRMYTLRVSYIETVGSGDYVYSVVRDHYCCNLSIDRDTAHEKAAARVNHITDAELVALDKVPTLEDIYYRNQAELEAARLAALASEKAAQEAWEEKNYRAHMDRIEKIKAGIWPFGKYKNQKFGGEIVVSFNPKEYAPDYSYILYWLKMELDEEDNTDKNHSAVVLSLQNALKSKFQSLLDLPKPNGEFYGEEKSRENFSLTKIAEFSFPNGYAYNGPDIHIQKFVKDSGELIAYKGTSPIKCKIGQTVTVKATIKGHNIYNGEKQTIISRPKEV